jgi:hypothetical protein
MAVDKRKVSEKSVRWLTTSGRPKFKAALRSGKSTMEVAYLFKVSERTILAAKLQLSNADTEPQDIIRKDGRRIN